MGFEPREIPQLLPIRLKPALDRTVQQGCALGLGMLLTVLGGGLLLAWWWIENAAAKAWPLPAVGAFFAAIGLLLLYSYVGYVLSASIPITIVELSHSPVYLGEPVEVCIQQAGPVNLRSLRVNVSCFEMEYKFPPEDDVARNPLREKNVFYQNILEMPSRWIAEADVAVQRCTFSVPIDSRPSGIEGRTMWIWRLEVWGRVVGRPGFWHLFIFKVKSRGES